MNDHKELIKNFRSVKEDEEINIYGNVLHEIADAIEQLVKERDELRNELCLRCGEYTEAHNGACNGCKWRAE